MKLNRIMFIFAIVMMWNTIAFAKYTYTFDEEIINLTRNLEAPICKVSYSEENWTNKSVVVKIEVNKEIENVSGFVLSEDRKTLTREVFSNEEDTVEILDIDGNIKQVMYSVQNIDKQAPKIIDCENEGIYEVPKKLEFDDNGEINKINVEKYSDTLLVEYNNVYYDQAYYFGIDRNCSTIEVRVQEKPLGTQKYRYYINNRLYKTTTEEKYIFTNLEKGTDYEVKVEAISEQDTVLDTQLVFAKTGYFKNIDSNKTENSFSALINGIDKSVSYIKYAYWNSLDVSNVKWKEARNKGRLCENRIPKI